MPLPISFSRKPLRIATMAPVLALTLAAVPALANDNPQDAPPPAPPPAYAPPPYAGYAQAEMAPEARESWLADCRARVGEYHRKRYANDFCTNYLNDYYARYRAPQPYYGYQGAAYGYPAYAGGCCQPMMMVPIMRMPKAEPECKETVEYEYVDVPVRATPRPKPRPAPDKRIKVK